MTDEEIYFRLTTIFRDVFDDDELELTPQLSASDVPEWDSLTHIRLILTVEKVFSLKFSATSIASLKNVRDLVNLISEKS